MTGTRPILRQTAGLQPAHRQPSYRVRMDWGPTGAAAVADSGAVAVVIDVLSFTTTLTVAVDAGIKVYPFRWKDERAQSYADEREAVLARGRSARTGVSLSPVTVRASSGVERLVLPSPNGSAISFGLAGSGAAVVGASLRNATAVARSLVAFDGPIAVVAAGERWPDGSLRPAVEDLWGAGAMLAALVDLGVTDLSPEAQVAAAAYRVVSDRIADELHACASGRELVDLGFAGDVEIAAEVDGSDAVPVLDGDAFVRSRA
jgi:2-phosphosulfolactate phosphatase